ncbi:MAG TPA: hypothetical protein PK987_08005 [Ferruginibacter sp.]|nr:hypothetical protein [Chitinophagaceae bacterium]MBK9533107.1 hypothetical protein [Chitinophagaceae bacterium]HQW84387.1 hypothetical protein [Ferruginibacter sp.]
MAETLSMQTGYIIESTAVASDEYPVKFERQEGGDLKITCEFLIPANTQGLKFNPGPKSDKPADWEYGEVEMPLVQNIAMGGNHRIFLTGIGNELNLNLRIKIAGKKVWQMPDKVWNMQ